MESLAIAVAETFEFLQPFCSAALRKQAAFESAPLKELGSNHTLATETDLTEQPPHETSVARVQYLRREPCDTSLTSSLSEDEMLLPCDPSFRSTPPDSPYAIPVPETVTFFNPHKRDVHLSGLSLQWHVKRSAGGHKGIDLWHGFLCEDADSREDTGGLFLGQVTCFRISPSFKLPTTSQERSSLQALHPMLASLAEYMRIHTTLPSTESDDPVFGLPVVLVSNVQVSEEHRGTGLGLLLVDETCRCLANPAQWVLLDVPKEAIRLRDYLGLLGFTASGLLDGRVIIRWNDPYCMATHRYEDLCPFLPRVAIQ